METITLSFAPDRRRDVMKWLRIPKAERASLYRRADKLRAEMHGAAVHIRGIIEFSNVCANNCLYCGIRRANAGVRRYRLSDDEIMAVIRRMPDWHQGTVVLQSGEQPSEEQDRRLGELVRRIKEETPLAVTLSVGNRPKPVYRYWRECGMDRYLLRFESSNALLFSRIHPDCSLVERLRCLYDLRDLGVQVGSGFMIGLPGETDEILADNILLCRELELDMIGIGPFIPHPDTPMADTPNRFRDDPEMFFVTLATLRLFNPRAHIPATTAFDAVFPGTGRDLVLQRGANVFMPNNSPGDVRKQYLLYPDKPCVDEESGRCSACVLARLAALGREVGQGPGHALPKDADQAKAAEIMAK